MSTPVDEKDFSDDLFAHTRMSFWDHIEELRTHMWKAIVGFVLAMIVSLFFGDMVLRFITAPVKRELKAFNYRKAAKVRKEAREGNMEFNQPTSFQKMVFYRPQLEMLLKGKPTAEINALARPITALDIELKRISPEEIENARPISDAEMVHLWMRTEQPVEVLVDEAALLAQLTKPPELATMSIMEGFMVWMKVSIYLGVVVGSPWIIYQLWSFVAAGLYPTEKAYVYRYLPLSIGLFLTGVCICQFWVIPFAIEYLLNFTAWLGFEPDLRLNEWLSFALFFPLIFGICFQLPLVMLVLYKLGIVDVDTYRKNRRMAMFAMAVVSMLLAASPDPWSMLAMTVPLWVLYEVGILLCHYSPRTLFEEDKTDTSDALVGV